MRCAPQFLVLPDIRHHCKVCIQNYVRPHNPVARPRRSPVHWHTRQNKPTQEEAAERLRKARQGVMANRSDRDPSSLDPGSGEKLSSVNEVRIGGFHQGQRAECTAPKAGYKLQSACTLHRNRSLRPRRRPYNSGYKPLSTARRDVPFSAHGGVLFPQCSLLRVPQCWQGSFLADKRHGPRNCLWETVID